MGIFVYDEKLKKVVKVKEIPYRVDDDIAKYINMRKTWSNQTKVEFNTTTVEDSVRKMGGSI